MISVRYLAMCSFRLCVLVFVVFSFFASVAYAEVAIQDSHGKYRFEEPPKRVVVLNWALAEQLHELGEVPVGMADIEGYRKHSNNAIVENTVVDVGGRLAPKIGQIKALKPDVILIGYSQRPFIRPLSNIATVIYFKNFGKRYNNEEKSLERFTELAKLFDKSALAKEKLAERDARLAQLKNKLHDHFEGRDLPSVQFIVPDSTNAAKSDVSLVFGENSMPFYAAKALGLTVVGAQKNDQFGLAQLSADELNLLLEEAGSNVCQFYLSSYTGQDRKSRAKLKRDDRCKIEPNYQNAFGGVMSIVYLAESIVDGLIKK